jgi:type VI secretion system VasD/TssJ family lipoprotein
MRHRLQSTTTAAVCCIALGLAPAGCAVVHLIKPSRPPLSTAPPSPGVSDRPTIHIILAPTPTMNSCGGPTGNVLTVRIYQLASSARFTALSLPGSWGHESDLLGADLLDSRDLILSPAAGDTVHFGRVPGARFLGLAADFCHTRESCWHVVVPISEKQMTATVTLSAECLSVQQQ